MRDLHYLDFRVNADGQFLIRNKIKREKIHCLLQVYVALSESSTTSNNKYCISVMKEDHI